MAPRPAFLVLGLGNPGPEYHRTRHNLGFLVTDALADGQGVLFREGPGPSWIAPFTVGADSGILAQPDTWMNRSGIAAAALLDRFESLEPSRLLVVADDLDLPLGRLRIRAEGGAGGHKGLRSLIEELGTPEFPRLRLGIGRPEENDREEVVDYVLQPFDEREETVVKDVVERATEAVRVFLEEGIDAAMSRFNVR